MAPHALHDDADLLREIRTQAEQVPKKDAAGYQISDNYLGQRRPLKVIIIGFGAAGIHLSHILGQNTTNNISIQCYEKNPEVGGTWLVT